jgi:plastocyanin
MHRQLSPLLALALIASTAPAANPEVVHLQTLRAQMRYSRTEIDTTPGAPVEILFENTDDMPHNVVFCQPGTDVVAMSNKQLEKPDEAVKRNFLPDDPAIWSHSKLLNPHEQEELSFKAPEKPGEYPYVCTMPGHAMSMRGTLRVLDVGKGLAGLTYKLYLGAWDKLPDFSKLEPHLQGDLPDNLIQLDMSDSKVNYGVVFAGKLTAPVTGDYAFAITNDDGARILIDGKQVVDYDGVHPAADIHEGKTHLKAGDHDFRLEYFQKQNEALVYAGWKGPTFGITALSKWLPPNWNTPAKPKRDEHSGMPLIAEKEPIMYRNFISGAGTRGIGVGYPGGFNIAWSAQDLNLALVWRGAFIDAARHWTDRGGGYQPPLGYDAFEPVDGLSVPFAIPSSGKIAWTKISADDRAADYQWKGYHLDEKRFPTFFYEWKGVKVSDRFDTDGNAVAGDGKLVRTLKLEGSIPPGTVFRAASGKVQVSGGAFLVKGHKLSLDGREFDNTFLVSAPNAENQGDDIVLPGQPEIKVTYSWPMEQMQHGHAP